MMLLDIPTTKGIKKEIAYNINDFPFESLENLETVKKKGVEYYNIPVTFDIESTTITPKNEDLPPFAFMYQWQMCVIDKVVFGRTWEEFTVFLDKLVAHLEVSALRKLVIYVHNLSYEFQFIKDFIKISSIFAKDKRKVMKLEIENGIEFRCSYFLSNMSLIKFCENTENVTYYKLQDTFDYRKIRTPKTLLSPDELAYCYNDVRGLAECIQDYLRRDTITSIPLTSTGFVRRIYRNAMRKNKNNFYDLQRNQPTKDVYLMLKQCFRGGNTHANRHFANCILDNVYSYDIQSSYPACIMLDDFPIGRFTEIQLNTKEKMEYYCKNYCVIMEAEFFNIDLNNDEVIPYIDIAHCIEKSNVVNDNGRVLKADYIKMQLTNIDLDIIRKTYHFNEGGGFNITKAYYCKKGKLPKELREQLLVFYKSKTELKNVENMEYEYGKAKNVVNATFGMMVTALDHTNIIYNIDTYQWKEEPSDIDNSLKDFYNNRNNFLQYAWGVFCTANARKRLQTMLDVVKEDVVYIDTDSIKFVDEKHIKEFEELNNKLIEECYNNDVTSYADKDGERFFLGIWDFDGHYSKFKTLGAKKYCYHKAKDNSFHITVSGMSKKSGAEKVGNIDNFIIGRTFHDVGRTVSYYNDCKPHKITVDGCTFTTASNIGIVDTTYTLGVTKTYWELIQNNKIDLEDEYF